MAPRICRQCDCGEMIRYGTRRGLQIWRCNRCGTRFTENGAQPGRQVSPEPVGRAIRLFFEGNSIGRVRERIGEIFGFAPSTASVHRWVHDFSILAQHELKHALPTQLGNEWLDESTPVRCGSHERRIRTVVDCESMFIVANQVTSDLDSGFRGDVLFATTRYGATVVTPKAPISSSTGTSLKAGSALVAEGNGSHTADFGHEPLTPEIAVSLKEAIRSCCAIIRRTKSLRSAEVLLEGWTIHFNYFERQKVLGGRSPAAAAGIQYELNSWEDIARLDVRPISHRRSRREVEQRKRGLIAETNLFRTG